MPSFLSSLKVYNFKDLFSNTFSPSWVGGIVLLLSIVFGAFYVGLLDFPPFIYQKSIGKEGSSFYVVLTNSHAYFSAKEACELFSTSMNAMKHHLPDLDEKLKHAAIQYGKPRAPRIGTMVYFEAYAAGLDTPDQLDSPKWGAGFLIASRDLAAVQDAIAEFNSKNPVSKGGGTRILSLGSGPAFRATIPWRSWQTPLWAHFFHWRRAYRLLASRPELDMVPFENEEVLACEIFIVDERDKPQCIDFVAIKRRFEDKWASNRQNVRAE